MIFHALEGTDMRESRSPSFFNPEELFIVVDYVKKLLEFNVDEDDIGIITPYRKQVQKLKWRLEERGMTDITVGTTEEFQGQERKVIIVSTVRYDAFLAKFCILNSTNIFQMQIPKNTLPVILYIKK